MTTQVFEFLKILDVVLVLGDNPQILASQGLSFSIESFPLNPTSSSALTYTLSGLHAALPILERRLGSIWNRYPTFWGGCDHRGSNGADETPGTAAEK